jgi:hypothetical protein
MEKSMSRIVAFPEARRVTGRAAMLEFIAQAGPRPARDAALGPEEQEFLDALRRIVSRSPAEDLWDKYRGDRGDRRSRIFARYAD